MNAINNNIEENKQQPEIQQPQTKKPDERGGIHVQGHIKIFDPQTKEVFVNGRA
jgi:hypothetical protein